MKTRISSRLASIVRRAWSTLTWTAAKAARSRWMSLAAAVSIVLGTAGTYKSGEIAAEVQICSFRLELFIANGSPVLRAGQEVSLQIYGAKTYLRLAAAAAGTEQRREFTYLAISAVNRAILTVRGRTNIEVDLWTYPTDRQLSSDGYISSLLEDIDRLEFAQLWQRWIRIDQTEETIVSDLSECARKADRGQAVGALALIFTLLSLTLIGFREYYLERKRS
jgi:hypothetical protein